MSKPTAGDESMDVVQSVDVPEGRIRADRIDIELESVHPAALHPLSDEAQRIKLYNMPNLAQKIQLWLIVLLSSGSLISNLSSIASTFGFFTSSSNNCTCPQPPQLWKL